MATSILSTAPQAVTRAPQYHLPEADRQAILAQSDSARQLQNIERKRAAFVQLHGCEFGQKPNNHGK